MEQTLRCGLQSTPKYLPSWFKYDKEGSELFSTIIQRQTPQYYFHRSEMSILKKDIEDMVPRNLEDIVLVDMGSGNDEKTRFFIDTILQHQPNLTYIPIDISTEFMEANAKELYKDYGNRITVNSFTGVFKDGLEFIRSIRHKRKIILWFGGFQNDPLKDQQEYMSIISTLMTNKCRLIISLDTTQDKDTILDAYLGKENSETQDFYLNNFHRLNRDYGADIDVDKLKIHGDYIQNDSPNLVSYVKIWAEALEPIQTSIPGLEIDLTMKKGERLYCQHGEGASCKYTIKQIEYIGLAGGMRLHQSWENDEHHAAFFCFVLKTQT